MELSIIIPVYNVERYIEECLSSIVKQVTTEMASKIEVILVNDGSKDNSRKICEKYCESYEYFCLYDQKNSGLSAARNSGARIANGKYLFFLDSDDYLTEELQELFTLIESSDSEIILGKKDCYFEENSSFNYAKMDFTQIDSSANPVDIFKKLCEMDFYWFIVPMVLIKRNFFFEKNLLFENGIYHEDELWVPMVFLQANTITLFNKSIYCYRVGRVGSIMNSYNIKREFDKLVITDKFQEYVEKNTDAIKISLLKERMAVLMWKVIRALGCYKDNDRRNELKKQIKKRIKYLKYGKYKLVYYAISIVGVEIVYLLDSVRVKLLKD